MGNLLDHGVIASSTVEGGTLGTGQFNYVSSGSSSFSDGKNYYQGSHMLSNVNGEVRQATTGNMPPGFFHSISSTPLGASPVIVIFSMVVLVAMLGVFVSLTRRSQRRQLELRNRRNLMVTNAASGKDLSVQLNQGPFFNPQKRPFANVMWNSQLLTDHELVEISLA